MKNIYDILRVLNTHRSMKGGGDRDDKLGEWKLVK